MLGATTTVIRTIDDVVNARAVTTVFQPIVRLDTREVVGYEALTRGPIATPWEAPLDLFAAAAAAGRLPELDWVCRANAYREALEAGLPPGMSLFVNAEPVALGVPCPPDLTDVILAAQLRLRVVVEMNERAIIADPASVFAATESCRSAGWGVAMDDVGTEPASLSFMPFVHPDVVKLDRHLTQRPGDDNTARVVNGVVAYAERAGAAILAEGVETERHLAAARAMGATLGQGWLFGRPGPLPSPAGEQPAPAAVPFVAAPSTGAGTRTPYEIVSTRRPTTEATKATLIRLSRCLEAKGVDATEPPLVLGCLQESRFFTPATARRYTAMARSSPLVAVLGTDLPGNPAPGVRGVALTDEDPLHGEWSVIVVGPHFSGALVARDVGDLGPDPQRRFTYALTYDRDLVLSAALALLHRIVPD